MQVLAQNLKTNSYVLRIGEQNIVVVQRYGQEASKYTEVIVTEVELQKRNCSAQMISDVNEAIGSEIIYGELRIGTEPASYQYIISTNQYWEVEGYGTQDASYKRYFRDLKTYLKTSGEEAGWISSADDECEFEERILTLYEMNQFQAMIEFGQAKEQFVYAYANIGS